MIDGQLILHLLEDHGIPSILLNQNAQGALGELPVVCPEVWIKRNNDLGLAIKTIQEHQVKTHTSQPIICQQCSEENPSSFEICWQCSHSLPV